MKAPRCPICGAAGRSQRQSKRIFDRGTVIPGAFECRLDSSHRWRAPATTDQVAELRERAEAITEQLQRLAADVRRVTGLRDTPLNDAIVELKYFRLVKLNARSPRPGGLSVSEGSAP